MANTEEGLSVTKDYLGCNTPEVVGGSILSYRINVLNFGQLPVDVTIEDLEPVGGVGAFSGTIRDIDLGGVPTGVPSSIVGDIQVTPTIPGRAGIEILVDVTIANGLDLTCRAYVFTNGVSVSGDECGEITAVSDPVVIGDRGKLGFDPDAISPNDMWQLLGELMSNMSEVDGVRLIDRIANTRASFSDAFGAGGGPGGVAYDDTILQLRMGALEAAAPVQDGGIAGNANAVAANAGAIADNDTDIATLAAVSAVQDTRLTTTETNTATNTGVNVSQGIEIAGLVAEQVVQDAATVAAQDAADAAQLGVDDHLADENNPHSTTADLVPLVAAAPNVGDNVQLGYAENAARLLALEAEPDADLGFSVIDTAPVNDAALAGKQRAIVINEADPNHGKVYEAGPTEVADLLFILPGDWVGFATNLFFQNDPGEPRGYSFDDLDEILRRFTAIHRTPSAWDPLIAYAQHQLVYDSVGATDPYARLSMVWAATAAVGDGPLDNVNRSWSHLDGFMPMLDGDVLPNAAVMNLLMPDGISVSPPPVPVEGMEICAILEDGGTLATILGVGTVTVPNAMKCWVFHSGGWFLVGSDTVIAELQDGHDLLVQRGPTTAGTSNVALTLPDGMTTADMVAKYSGLTVAIDNSAGGGTYRTAGWYVGYVPLGPPYTTNTDIFIQEHTFGGSLFQWFLNWQSDTSTVINVVAQAENFDNIYIYGVPRKPLVEAQTVNALVDVPGEDWFDVGTRRFQSGVHALTGSGEGNETISFPEPFLAGTTPVVTVSVLGDNTASEYVRLNGNPTPTGFDIWRDSVDDTGGSIATNDSVHWMAIGLKP